MNDRAREKKKYDLIVHRLFSMCGLCNWPCLLCCSLSSAAWMEATTTNSEPRRLEEPLVQSRNEVRHVVYSCIELEDPVQCWCAYHCTPQTKRKEDPSPLGLHLQLSDGWSLLKRRSHGRWLEASAIDLRQAVALLLDTTTLYLRCRIIV